LAEVNFIATCPLAPRDNLREELLDSTKNLLSIIQKVVDITDKSKIFE